MQTVGFRDRKHGVVRPRSSSWVRGSIALSSPGSLTKHTERCANVQGVNRCSLSDKSNVFNFQSTVLDPLPRRRAWDRIPKSPFGPRHQGRKLWKRYDTRSWKAAAICGPGDDTAAPQVDENGNSAPEKAIKRLRLKQSPSSCAKEDGASLSARYITTLRDDAPGTPKSQYQSQEQISWIVRPG